MIEQPDHLKGSSCTHPTARYSPEHDNFYCTVCHAGMGEEFYKRNAHLVRQWKFDALMGQLKKECDQP